MQLQCHLCKSLNPYVPGVDLYCTAGKVTTEGSNLVSYNSRKCMLGLRDCRPDLVRTSGRARQFVT